MSRSTIDLIVVGCGRLVTEVHLPNLAGMDAVRVVGLVDPDKRSLAKAKHLAGDAACFENLEEALENVPSDGVLIASPSGLHAAMAMAALEADRYVYLEKPVATDWESARLLAQHPASHRMMVGFNYRFHPIVREMRELARTGTFGDVVCIRTMFSTPDINAPAWKKTRETGGGALLDLTTHDADMIRFVAGREITAVSAHITSRHAEGDTASLLLECEDGMTAQCVGLSGCAETARMEVIGELGGGSFDRYRSSCVEVWGRNVGGFRERFRSMVREAKSTPQRMKQMRHPWNDSSFGAAIESFIKAIRQVKPPRVRVEDGLRSLSILLAAEESMRTGCRVSVTDITPSKEFFLDVH